jgi:osmoprotectant transport system permease protein
MELLRQLFEFLSDPAHWTGSAGIPNRLLQHLGYTGLALLVATAVALPVGLLIGHTGKGAFLAINAGNAARSLPTLGVLILVVLFAGLGITPVLIALVALAIPPILTATYAGVRNVEPDITDAARGMGMTERQVLVRAELPVALPLILSGMRSATLQVVATATVAAYVALGGLGRFLIDGLAVRDYSEMFAGAVLVALLAILLDLAWAGVQRLIVSDGLTGRVRRLAVTPQTPSEEPILEHTR